MLKFFDRDPTCETTFSFNDKEGYGREGYVDVKALRAVDIAGEPGAFKRTRAKAKDDKVALSTQTITKIERDFWVFEKGTGRWVAKQGGGGGGGSSK